MTLPPVGAGTPHIEAHNQERTAINGIKNFTDPDFKALVIDEVSSRPVVQAGAIDAYGHSYLSGASTSVAGATTGVDDMQTLVSKNLGLPSRSHAVSGASLYNAASQGDWASVLQDETRGNSFETRGGLFVNMWGLNDAAQLGSDYEDLIPFREALRTVVARQRCAAVFEDNHPSVVYGGAGTWGRLITKSKNSGDGYSRTTFAGATVTINLPWDFPGGTIVLGFPAPGNGESANWTTIGGDVTHTVSTSEISQAGDNPTVTVMRIENVRRNQGTIQLMSSNVSGPGATFDWWGWEPEEDAGSVVVLVGQPKPLDYTAQAGAPAGPVGDDGVDAINQIQQEVASEFGARVLFVDTSELDGLSTYWETGNIHPNAAGHALLADLISDEIKSAVTITHVPSPTRTDIGWSTYAPWLDGPGAVHGNAETWGVYARQPDGTISFEGEFKMGTTTVLGTAPRLSVPVTEAGVGIGKILVIADFPSVGYWELLGQLGVVPERMLLRLPAYESGAPMVSVTSTYPVTWPPGTIFKFSGTYRAAT